MSYNETANSLFDKISVINIGLYDFYAALVEQGVDVVHVEWSPPIIMDEEIRNILDGLL